MRFSSFLGRCLLSPFLTLLIVGCGGGSGGGGSSGSNTTTAAAVTPAHFTATSYATIGTSTGNTMTLGVNDSSQCGSNYQKLINLPCVSVKICSVTNPTTCQTINNILLDTGSYGLRIFKSVINSSVQAGLQPIMKGSNQLAECVLYGDGSSDWGPVEYAYVQLGNEPKVGVPIQVIDSTFQTPPSACSSPNSTPDTGPSVFNGILGVGYLAQDCGVSCASSLSSSSGGYYTCLNGSCNSGTGTGSGAYVDVGAQVTNPVAALPTDNNGVVITLPSVGSSGTTSVTGTLTLGVGTSSAVSAPSIVLQVQSASKFPANTQDGFITEMGSSYSSSSSNWLAGFLDTGSNLYYFGNGPTQCSGGTYDTFFCPSSTTTVNVVTSANTSGSTTSTTGLSIANASTVITSTNFVYGNIGAALPTSLSTVVDFGLPFFFGRTVVVGINGRAGASGVAGSTGPYFAY
jgi:hypothetical protein